MVEQNTTTDQWQANWTLALFNPAPACRVAGLPRTQPPPTTHTHTHKSAQFPPAIWQVRQGPAQRAAARVVGPLRGRRGHTRVLQRGHPGDQAGQPVGRGVPGALRGGEEEEEGEICIITGP